MSTSHHLWTTQPSEEQILAFPVRYVAFTPAPSPSSRLTAISPLQNLANIVLYLELTWKASFHLLPKFTFAELTFSMYISLPTPILLSLCSQEYAFQTAWVGGTCQDNLSLCQDIVMRWEGLLFRPWDSSSSLFYIIQWRQKSANYATAVQIQAPREREHLLLGLEPKLSSCCWAFLHTELTS